MAHACAGDRSAAPQHQWWLSPNDRKWLEFRDRPHELPTGRIPTCIAVFVEKYEEEHQPIPPVSGVDMLHYLIETRQKTQREVAAGAGLADSTISEILAGKRKLSVKQVKALARFFKVKAAIFLDG